MNRRIEIEKVLGWSGFLMSTFFILALTRRARRAAGDCARPTPSGHRIRIRGSRIRGVANTRQFRLVL